MLNSTIPKRYVRTAIVGAAVFGAAWTFPAIAISNPSEVQYGYDPIVDAGGNESAQPGSRTPSPDERVQEATKVVDEIASSQAGNAPGSDASALSEVSSDGGGGARPNVRQPDTNRKGGDGSRSEGEILRTGPSGQPSSGDEGFSLYSNSWWLIGSLLLLALALAIWAFSRRGRVDGSGAVDLAVRSVALLAFIALIIVLNGSGSLLG